MTLTSGPPEPRIFVVLGSHRAGTSVLARVLQLIGLYLGEEGRLLGSIEHDNERGFYEHEELMQVSDELLQRMQGSWRRPPALAAGWELQPTLDDLRERARRLIADDFAGRSPWGFKDPRLSLTLPFWRTLIAPTGHVIAHRCPLDVARSLERRNGIQLSEGVSLWTRYMASAIANTTGQQRFIAGYEELLGGHREVVSGLAGFLGLPDPGDDPGKRETLREAVDRDLRHHASSPEELAAHPAMSSEAHELFALVEQAVRSRGEPYPTVQDVGPVKGSPLDALAARIIRPRPGRRPASSPPPPPSVSSSVSPAPAPVSAPDLFRSAPAIRPPRLGPRRLRIVAMLQVFNERRFLAGCIEHLSGQGIEVYVIDNQSTDETLEIAQRYLGKGVRGIETLPRRDCFALRTQCKRQEELAMTLDADWLIHHDADEIRASSSRGETVAEAIEEADGAGFNAVDFFEFTFVPTREFPDHDHPDFARTMRWYYPFLPHSLHRCNAWKRQEERVDLATTAGHAIRFPGLRIAPKPLYMRHYLYISRQHAIEKFVQRRFAEDEVADGWFGWRSRMRPEMIALPSVAELRPYLADHLLDPSEPRKRHVLDQPEIEVAAPAPR